MPFINPTIHQDDVLTMYAIDFSGAEDVTVDVMRDAVRDGNIVILKRQKTYYRSEVFISDKELHPNPGAVMRLVVQRLADHFTATEEAQ